MKNIHILLLILITLTQVNMSRAHDDSSKDRVAKAYEQLFQELKVSNTESKSSIENLNTVKIRVGNKTIFFPEPTLALLVSEKIKLYEDVVEQECECDITEFRKENKKRIRIIVKKVVNFLPELAHTIGDLLWSEVSGVRRFGVVYLVVSAIGEIIDHNISPVPLCKFVAFLSRAISDKIKTGLALSLPYYQGISFNERIKALYSRMHYRKVFRKKWRRVLFNNEKEINQKSSKSKFKQFVESFELGEKGRREFPRSLENYSKINIKDEIKLVFQNNNTIERMWYSDRLVDFLNFTYLLTLDQAKKVKRLKKIDKKNFMKLQWDIGKYGDEIDKLKILLYVSSQSNNFEKYENLINLKIMNILNGFEKYQVLFSDIKHSWTSDSRLSFYEMNKEIISVKKSKCKKMLNYLLNWKLPVLASAAYLSYIILTEKGDVLTTYSGE